MSGVASSPSEVSSYAACTLLAASLQQEEEDKEQNSIDACIDFLSDSEFITLRKVTDQGKQRSMKCSKQT